MRELNHLKRKTSIAFSVIEAVASRLDETSKTRDCMTSIAISGGFAGVPPTSESVDSETCETVRFQHSSPRHPVAIGEPQPEIQ